MTMLWNPPTGIRGEEGFWAQGPQVDSERIDEQFL